MRSAVIAVVIVGALVYASAAAGAMLLLHHYRVTSEAMAPTLRPGDRVLVESLSLAWDRIRPGDVIVFAAPHGWAPARGDQLKRVIAVGGQTVRCRQNTGLTVGDAPLLEPYLDEATMGVSMGLFPCLGYEFGPVTVPADRLWVMGDDRTYFSDSRAHCESTPGDLERGLLCTGAPRIGTVPVDDVVGRVRYVVSPAARRGPVDRVDRVQSPSA